LADTWTADGTCRGKLAATAAVFVRVVADSVCLEFACSRIAALIVATASLATAIALFVAFNDTVTTRLASDSSNAFVVRETSRFDTVACECRANVADRTGRETRNASGSRRVHDKTFAGITRGGAKRTTLL
jgi:hypothetical protein